METVEQTRTSETTSVFRTFDIILKNIEIVVEKKGCYAMDIARKSWNKQEHLNLRCSDL